MAEASAASAGGAAFGVTLCVENPTKLARPLHFGLARRLRSARLAVDLGGQPLSLAAQLASTAVRSIEVEGRVPSVEAVEKLAAVLRVSPCFLAFGVERPFDERAVGRISELPARLRFAREQSGLSQNALAKAAGVARTMIGYIESGATMPSVATIELLASALRVSPCWLAFAEGEPQPASRTAPERSELA
ncbi:MAG: helix-turn-helix transcriptional regulator [Myxococcales bacterium]|nr:helix-turn-helix transcriptional regulator [Myxococcales bacterium]